MKKVTSWQQQQSKISERLFLTGVLWPICVCDLIWALQRCIPHRVPNDESLHKIYQPRTSLRFNGFFNCRERNMFQWMNLAPIAGPDSDTQWFYIFRALPLKVLSQSFAREACQSLFWFACFWDNIYIHTARPISDSVVKRSSRSFAQ